MNGVVYVFGELSSGYTQYPDDSVSDIFKSFYEKAKAATQVTIHRAGNLMYYGYIRRLPNHKYIGLCVVLNGEIIKSIKSLFSIFEKAIADLIEKGDIIYLAPNGDIATGIEKLQNNEETIKLVQEQISQDFDKINRHELPAINYSVSKNSFKDFCFLDNQNEIVKASHTFGYTYIYKEEDYDAIHITSSRAILKQLNQENTELKELNKKLKNTNAQILRQQKQYAWVSIFAIVAIILGIVVWNQVLFPNEVTKKDMGEFVYYGPIRNGEPNGTGVAIYHENDKDGRLYYYGNFTNGQRIDEKAIMFYKDGSYFSGSMNEDQWFKGLFFNVDKELYVGEFKNNVPWNGEWYKHVKVQTITNGQ